MQTEKQIVESVRKGEREGQDEMFRRFVNQVFCMIVKQVPDIMDAQELTQDTFLKAFRHIDRYDARQFVDELKQMVTQIVRQVLADHSPRIPIIDN